MKGNWNHLREAQVAKDKWERYMDLSIRHILAAKRGSRVEWRNNRRAKKWITAEVRAAKRMNRCIMLLMGNRRAKR